MPNPFPYSTPPVLVDVSPREGYSVGLHDSLALAFDQRIFAGTGTIEIRRSADGSLFESIPITDTERIRFLRYKLVIDPARDFEPAGHYYVTFNSGTLLNLAGLPFAGLTSPTDFDFPIGGMGVFSPVIYPGSYHQTGVSTTTDIVISQSSDLSSAPVASRYAGPRMGCSSNIF